MQRLFVRKCLFNLNFEVKFNNFEYFGPKSTIIYHIEFNFSDMSIKFIIFNIYLVNI